MSIGELQEAIKTSNLYIVGIEEWYEVQTLKEYKCVSQIVTENILNIIKEKSSKKQKACIMPYRQEEKTSSLHPSVIKLLSVQSKEIMMKAKRHKNQVKVHSEKLRTSQQRVYNPAQHGMMFFKLWMATGYPEPFTQQNYNSSSILHNLRKKEIFLL